MGYAVVPTAVAEVISFNYNLLQRHTQNTISSVDYVLVTPCLKTTNPAHCFILVAVSSTLEDS
jgi:hypothetical protein